MIFCVFEHSIIFLSNIFFLKKKTNTWHTYYVSVNLVILQTRTTFVFASFWGISDFFAILSWKLRLSCRLLIEERITMLSKMFLLLRSSFLSRIQQKKVEGQTFLGFVLLIWLSVYFVAGKTIFRCLISACLHCLWQKNTLTLDST